MTMFNNLKYCVRCCIPETEEGTSFDEFGCCQACRSSEEKIHINWVDRERHLRNILDKAKESAGTNYDCILPISGGKDSTFQMHMLVNVYGMKPLAVTYSHNWYSEIGWYNLVNALEKFNVDHIMFTPNRGLVNKLARQSLFAIGDACWHCHAGVGSFPLQIAVKFGIPLLVYGEPASEGHGFASYSEPRKYDRDYFTEVSAKKKPDEMITDDISAKDIDPYQLPSYEEIESSGVKGIHLGDYIFWDDERLMEFVRDTYGWRETEMEGSYKGYKSVECIMPGVHDFTWYLKRGYARSSAQASVDVRNGLMSRAEGFELAKKYDPVRPEALDYFLKITGLSEEEFYKAMEEHKVSQLKGVDLPVLPKSRSHSEKILPIAQQIVDKFNTGIVDPPKQALGQNPVKQTNSIENLTINGIIQGYKAGDFTPVDIAQVSIDKYRSVEPRSKAWVIFDEEKLIGQAEFVKKRIIDGEPVRSLEGIPLGIKDVFNTRDYPTQMGSPLWEGFTPGNDARVVDSLRRSGAMIAGKTVTSEFAVHALGKTINPHDASRNPGTSSSGSAAAVALGMVPAAIATQTASSIVRPASYCGVYGCKPSFGLVPRTGILKTTDSLDSIGFFSRYAEDIERIFDVIRIHGTNYPISNSALSDLRRQSKPPGEAWKVALVETHTWDFAEDYARQSFLDFGKVLSNQENIEVDYIELPPKFSEAHQIHATIYERSLANYFKEEFSHGDLISGEINEMIERGNQVTPDKYKNAIKDQDLMVRHMDHQMSNFDVMISLSTAGEAPLREEAESDDSGLIWTMTYLPVISAPVFTGPNGLPFGVQLMARRYNDPLLFRFMEYLGNVGLIPRGPNPSVNPGI